jgi:hypothetical protein
MTTSGITETVSIIEIPRLNIFGSILHVIKVPPDGSCFFHSVLRGFHKDYIAATTLEERKQLCRKLRTSTSESLEEKNTTTNMTEYDSMGNGYYKKFNEATQGVDGDLYSLKALQRELLSSSAVNHAYIEILSNHLILDIYIISAVTGDLYLTGTEKKLLYKERRSIVLLYTPGHYDIIGIKRDTPSGSKVIFDTLFSTNHKFILAIKERMLELNSD